MEKVELKSAICEFSSKFVKDINIDQEKIKEIYTDFYDIYVPDLSSLRFKDGKINYFLDIKKDQKRNVFLLLDFYEFYEILQKEYRELENIQESISLIYKIEEKNAKTIIMNFVYNLIEKNKRPLKDNQIIKIVDDFFQRLEGKSFFITTKVFLDGIWLEKDEYKINDLVKIRRIKPNDFECQSPEQLRSVFDLTGNFAYTILKLKCPFRIDPKNPSELQIQILKDVRILIDALLLYRFGAVFSRKCILPAKITGYGQLGIVAGFGYRSCNAEFTKDQVTHINSHILIKSRHTYTLSEKDLTNLDEIFSILSKKEIREILLATSKNLTYINIALSRYSNAFINIENIDSQISYAVSCLEALFSSGGLELQHKLSQRVSCFFKIIGFNPLIIIKIVKNAYKVRSKYSHGEIFNFEDKLKLSKQILQIARISILIFIQIDPIIIDKTTILSLHHDKVKIKDQKEKTIRKNRKDYFLEIIDDSIVDGKTYARLQNFLLKHCCIYL